jgi:hypothetical protein
MGKVTRQKMVEGGGDVNCESRAMFPAWMRGRMIAIVEIAAVRTRAQLKPDTCTEVTNTEKICN